MSAGGDTADECRRTARALAPCARHDGGVTLSGSSAAALAELFRVLARDGADVTDAAERAARRIRADAEAGAAATARTAPAPRTPAEPAPGALAAR
ncbi:hypothetical protein ACQPX6_06390 [Actinomycetospora sp. CA-101289]|uniref:hypothetical protein n=1 Tax=Actinomycetospora sp. CA-101289 TaxID=3239893 RepID=UPI003D977F9A